MHLILSLFHALCATAVGGLGAMAFLSFADFLRRRNDPHTAGLAHDSWNATMLYALVTGAAMLFGRDVIVRAPYVWLLTTGALVALSLVFVKKRREGIREQ